MNEPLFIARNPRQLSKIEVIDIHILVKSTRTALRLPNKPKEEKSETDAKA